MIKFLAASFACYRLAQLIAVDDGPWCVFSRLRSWAGRCAAAEQGRGVQNGACCQFANLLDCPFCLGIWFAFALAFLVAWNVGSFILLWFGIAGVQAFLQEVVDGARNGE